MAEQMSGQIIEVSVPKGTTVLLDKMFGLFILNCLTGSGYNEYPIVGYANARGGTVILGGFYDNASFDGSGALVIRGLESSDLRYRGILFGNKN